MSRAWRGVFASAGGSHWFPGDRTMSRQKQPAAGTAASDARREREVEREIENFMRALTSYPDRFARDPYLSFEQHLFRIAAADRPLTGESLERG
jgi:hypothetical protein